MVRQAYSSGVPAIGVGTGNVVTIIDGTTDMDSVADLVTRSKSFDHATSCSTENNLIVFESCYDDFMAAMAKKGGFLIKEGTPEKEKMLMTLWPASPANHELNRGIVAQSAMEIAKQAGVSVPDGTIVIMVEENGGYGNEFPFTGEKLSPVSGVRRCKDFDEAVDQMMKMLDYQGKGHSCGIHTNVKERVTLLGEKAPVCKVCVNHPQSLTNSGSWTSGFPMSMSIACGTWGFNSISHNATWKDLLNYTYVSRPIPDWQPKDEELFDKAIVDKVEAI
jgi:sulfoacetaldehyde dehydrogenase